MADESEPESKPITVSELIARSGGQEAFPRSESMQVKRSAREVGASGMPGFTPPGKTDGTTNDSAKNDANAVTGIIPVVNDDADTGTIRAVEADDVFDYDLPAATAAPTPPAAVDDSVEDTTSIPLVADTPLGGDADVDTDDESIADTDADEADGDQAGGDRSAGDDVDDKADREKAKAKADRKKAKAAKARARAAKDADGAKSEHSPALGWLAFAGELVLGLAIGAGLFWGFTELWKSYVYLALILAVVVIFAIVTFAHVLRKRDLPTTLLALGVGMLVTIGPLVLLAAQP